jgi:hypothetical protein
VRGRERRVTTPEEREAEAVASHGVRYAGVGEHDGAKRPEDAREDHGVHRRAAGPAEEVEGHASSDNRLLSHLRDRGSGGTSSSSRVEDDDDEHAAQE